MGRGLVGRMGIGCGKSNEAADPVSGSAASRRWFGLVVRPVHLEVENPGDR